MAQPFCWLRRLLIKTECYLSLNHMCCYFQPASFSVNPNQTVVSLGYISRRFRKINKPNAVNVRELNCDRYQRGCRSNRIEAVYTRENLERRSIIISSNIVVAQQLLHSAASLGLVVSRTFTVELLPR